MVLLQAEIMTPMILFWVWESLREITFGLRALEEMDSTSEMLTLTTMETFTHYSKQLLQVVTLLNSISMEWQLTITEKQLLFLQNGITMETYSGQSILNLQEPPRPIQQL